MIHLYVKTHNKTGLKYFGKTVQDPYRYRGSGKHWKAHVRKHGNDVSTEVVGSYEDVAECMQAALRFSAENDIVASAEWANLIEENGLDGAPIGHPGHKFTADQKQQLAAGLSARWQSNEYHEKVSAAHKARWAAKPELRTQQTERLRDEYWTQERKTEHSKKMRGRKPSAKFLAFTQNQRSEQHKQAISDALKGKKKTEEHKEKLRAPKPLVVCRVHDRKLMALGNFMNWLKRFSPSVSQEISI